MKSEISSLNATELLEVIFDYLAEVSSRRDFDQVIEILAKMGKALSGADRCSIWIVSDDNKSIMTKVADGIEPITLPMGSGIVGESIVNAQRYIIDDVYKDERFNQEIDNITGYKTSSMMVIPMYDYNEHVIGAFQVINRRGNQGTFDSRDMERLTLATTYAAETIVSAQLTKEIEETQREVVFTMGAIGESRSKETGNHVKRVAEYSRLLALAYGLSESDAELLKQASPMHDIGKVAIPDSILNKPGRFDENERYIMNKHAELGYNMIKNSERPLLQAAAIVAYEHHEKWDGSGYPNKKSGEDIHIFARITALADVFDALGSDRVYKKAWSDERIFSLLQEERGKHFEPRLIDLFFENLEAICKVRDTFRDDFIEQRVETDKKIEILGAYGTRSKECATSSVLLNRQNVIDAGNLIAGLETRSIDLQNIWITHAHLDHIVDIAPMIDNYYSQRNQTLNILGLPNTLKSIQKNILNDEIWPDFSKIKLKNQDVMAVTYTEVQLNKEYRISEHETIRPIATDHTVESCGYVYMRAESGVLITEDTFSLKNIIEELENNLKIKSVVIECSFPNEMEELARVSKHLTPKLLFKQLESLKREDVNLYINHIKPAYIEKIVDEIALCKGRWEPIILKDGDFVSF